ncbi:MFS transporter, partial [Pandoraea nosoerga]|nr:MFS transporter [Pandoraea nosoerga]
GTLLIAIAPPYQTAGFLGTAMVVIGRLLSGFAASGESGAAGALVIESCPPHRRGWYGAVFSASTYLALAAGSGLALLVFGTLGVERTLDWGWRIGFVVGLCVIPVGACLRRHMNESLHPGAMQASGTE